MKKTKKKKKEKKKDHLQDRVTKGLRFFSEEDYDKARVSFASVLKANSENATVYHMLAESLLRSGDIESGKKNYEEAHRRDSNIWISRGLAMLKKSTGDKDGAEAVLKECIQKNHSSPWAYLNLASFYRETGDLEHAINILNDAVEHASELPVVWGLVQTLLEQDSPEEMTRQFSRFLVLTPKHWLGYHLLSRCFIRQNQFDKAFDAQDKSINLIRNEMSHSARYLYSFYSRLIAYIYLEKSFISFLLYDYDEVVNACLNSLRYNPKLWEGMYFLGAGYLYQGLLDKGRTALIKYCNILDGEKDENLIKLHEPVRLSAQLLIGQSYINQSSFYEAIDVYKKLIEEKSDIIEAYLNAGYSYFCIGDVKASKEMFIKLLDFKPDNVLALNNLGFLEMHERNLEVAKNYFLKAIEVSSDYPLPYVNLGFIFTIEGDYKSAEELLLKALKVKEPEEASLKIIYPSSIEENTIKGGPPIEENKSISSHIASLCNLGASMARRKDYKGAHLCFDKLIEVLPQYHFGYRGKGWTYFLENNYKEASGYMKKAFEKNSEYKILQQEYEFIQSRSDKAVETKKMASVLESFFNLEEPLPPVSDDFQKVINEFNPGDLSGGDFSYWDNLLIDFKHLLIIEKNINLFLEDGLKELEMVSSWRLKPADMEKDVDEEEGDALWQRI